MQKTNFKYEILIYDDASTDNTQNIVQEYEKKYPDLIKPIYQKENQYSKGKKVSNEFNYKRATGKYIAICEGDDYWTDPFKLQKQYDVLESNNDISLCVHASKIYDVAKKRIVGKIKPFKIDKYLTTSEILADLPPVHTSSLFFRREYANCFPKFYFNYKQGGHSTHLLFLSLVGKVYYLKDFMSVWRKNVPNSWSSRISGSTDLRINANEDLMIMLNEFNEYTNYMYKDIIHKKQNEILLRNILLQGEFHKIKQLQLERYYRKLPIKVKLYHKIKHKYPYLLKMYRSIFR